MRRTLVALLLVAVFLAVAPAAAGAHVVQQPNTSFHEVPTHQCECPSIVASSVGARPAAVQATPTVVYDEQIGVTFTQSFTALAFNVTATEQTDASSGNGPAYLLNGLSDTGFWYQVGLSWNWNPGATPGTGFDMNYEVFNPRGQSVFPPYVGGGLQAFPRTVNQGDIVLLNLYFTTAEVVMSAHDWNTGSTVTVRFTAEGATSFVGDARGNANTKGFFTGLMTEWYHPEPFLSNERGVTYIESGAPLTSAWMWMDEYSPNTGRNVFVNETSSPISFVADPMKLQGFVSNGATEYMDAYELITGALNHTASTVPLTLSYSVVGGGADYSPPVLEYTSGAERANATLTTFPVTYNLDGGTGWSVATALEGSTASQRWEIAGGSNGSATEARAAVLSYYHQYSLSVSYSVKGAPAPSPVLNYSTFGRSTEVPVGKTTDRFWMDARSVYGMSSSLPGSDQYVRWMTNSVVAGRADSALSLSPTYYEQFAVTARYEGTGEDVSSPNLVYTSFGASASVFLTTAYLPVWADAGSIYSLPTTLNGSSSERWVTNSTSERVTQGLVVSQLYVHQYYVAVRESPPVGGTISSDSGWYGAGSALSLTAMASNGWKFESWVIGNGSNPLSEDSLSVRVIGPLNLTGIFYPGLTVSSAPGVSVAYDYNEATAIDGGTVPGGTSSVIFVPPGGVTLAAAPSFYLYSFTGWSGTSTSHVRSLSLSVNGPTTVYADSGLDYANVGATAGLLLLVVAIAVAAARVARDRRTAGSPAAQ